MILRLLLTIALVESSTPSSNSECGCDVNRDSQKIQKSTFLNGISAGTDEQCLVRRDFLDNELFKEDMVLIPNGRYQVGTDDTIIEQDKEGPKTIVKLKSFYLDKYEVSNEDFHKFTVSNKYKTEAEKFGDSFVFSLFLNNTFKEQMKDFRAVQALWWYKINGADWKHPFGVDSDINILGMTRHPVIHVSWSDAQAYCKWRGARLPTEAEWEAACRGGHEDYKYPWGDKLYPNHTHMANIWQGTFPNYNSEKDGYLGTSPVNSFPPNDFGLYNMAGNVWEWTEDSWSENQPNEKVKKGGSYLCHRSYCYRYRCSARSHNTVDSSAGNLGFRCAKSA